MLRFLLDSYYLCAIFQSLSSDTLANLVSKFEYYELVHVLG